MSSPTKPLTTPCLPFTCLKANALCEVLEGTGIISLYGLFLIRRSSSVFQSIMAADSFVSVKHFF